MAIATDTNAVKRRIRAIQKSLSHEAVSVTINNQVKIYPTLRAASRDTGTSRDELSWEEVFSARVKFVNPGAQTKLRTIIYLKGLLNAREWDSEFAQSV